MFCFKHCAIFVLGNDYYIYLETKTKQTFYGEKINQCDWLLVKRKEEFVIRIFLFLRCNEKVRKREWEGDGFCAEICGVIKIKTRIGQGIINILVILFAHFRFTLINKRNIDARRTKISLSIFTASFLCFSLPKVFLFAFSFASLFFNSFYCLEICIMRHK